MNKYIVLLRGINVGGKNLVPMKELVLLLEQNGFKNVKTYIQSGNIILEGKEALPETIARLVKTRFDFQPDVIVLNEQEFDAAVKNNPFNPTEGKFAHFYFCSKVPMLDPINIQKYQSASEQVQLKGKVFYLHAPDGIGRSKLVSNIESCLNVSATGRNMNTINKLIELLETS